MNSTDMVLTFVPSRDGTPMTTAKGRVAFADKQGPQPQIGETWLCRLSGESRNGRAAFVKLVRPARVVGVEHRKGYFYDRANAIFATGLPVVQGEWSYRAYTWSAGKSRITYYGLTLASRTRDDVEEIVCTGEASVKGGQPSLAFGADEALRKADAENASREIKETVEAQYSAEEIAEYVLECRAKGWYVKSTRTYASGIVVVLKPAHLGRAFYTLELSIGASIPDVPASEEDFNSLVQSSARA